MRTPPLNALRAFEAAARHASFTLAAKELHVSAGAISRQVKILEDFLEISLFVRHAQGITPTQDALSLLPKLTASFAAIANATAEISKPKLKIKVTSSPTFANRWLVPRLPRFKEHLPGSTVTLGTIKYGYDELIDSDFDCAVATFYNPQWPDELKVERIKPEELTPLCAPALHHSKVTLTSPPQLEPESLLHMSACQYDWPAWASINNLDLNVDIDKGSSFDTGEMAIRAAVEGLGVILMDRFLVENELQSGQLIDMYPDTVPLNNGYYFFCDRNRWNEPAIASFRQWLHIELGKTGEVKLDPLK